MVKVALAQGIASTKARKASMDPTCCPRLEDEERRRRRAPLFRHSKMPVRMLVPNFFTLLACAPA